MSLARIFLLAAITSVLAVACSEPEGQSAEYFVFGTLTEVHLPEADAEEAGELLTRLHQEFQRMHYEWHAWEPGELTRLNEALQAGRTVPTTHDLLELVRLSQQMERRSGGRFNAAIGKLIELWGFHTSEYPIEGPPPSAARIRDLVDSQPSAHDVEFASGALRTANPQVQFDFGGIAKGYALDLAAEMIREAGQTSAILNSGGDIRTLGDKGGQPWRIALRDPLGGIAGAVEVRGNRAVFTSGNYERFREDGEERFPHILDPGTGWPVTSVSSATVVADDGPTADAAATAIVVAGPEHWPRVAAAMGVDAVLVIEESGRMRATEAMMGYFTPEPGRTVEVFGGD